jgi:uncharacterized repeat protein (TIGR03803 family)
MRKMQLQWATVFVLLLLVSTAAGAQTYSVLYNFGTVSGDPAYPFLGAIAQGRDGNMYSTTQYGGTNNVGTVWKITPAGALTVLYNFDTTHGASPDSGLTLGTDGNFYGTTQGGGTDGCGTVFKITPTGTLTVLYNFTCGTDGKAPVAPLTLGRDGNFYSTTSGDSVSLLGTVYKMTPAGKLTTLYQFDGTKGSQPEAVLTQGNDGNFYGTAVLGGTSNNGTVFKITPSGTLIVLYNFDFTHGSKPYAQVIQGTDGNLYGTAYQGGTLGGGTVFKLTLTGALTVLHNFSDQPLAGLVQANDGYFYGTTYGLGKGGDGTIFRINPKGAITTVHTFNAYLTGLNPETTLLQHTNGTLYSDTAVGGSGPTCSPETANNCGVFYSFTPNPALKPLVSLVTTSGKVGAKVGILGQNFSKSSVVTFGSAPATAVTFGSSTFLTATVPAGAVTGVVTVTTTSGTLTSNKKFRVTPQLASFAPPSGPVATVVTITGVSLTQTSRITFGGIAATTFTVNSDTSVSVTVPIGAATGKIAITTPGGTAVSATSFTVM